MEVCFQDTVISNGRWIASDMNESETEPLATVDSGLTGPSPWTSAAITLTAPFSVHGCRQTYAGRTVPYAHRRFLTVSLTHTGQAKMKGSSQSCRALSLPDCWRLSHSAAIDGARFKPLRMGVAGQRRRTVTRHLPFCIDGFTENLPLRSWTRSNTDAHVRYSDTFVLHWHL